MAKEDFVALRFRSTKHSIRVTSPKKIVKNEFGGVEIYPPGTKIELVIELPPEAHHLIKDIEFRQNNMMNQWCLES